eukprot:15472984-Alexandrium_andersonii.AAC.1
MSASLVGSEMCIRDSSFSTMCEPPSDWDVAATAPSPSSTASAPTMVPVQIHPGASFHLRQPGSVASGVPASGAPNPRVARERGGTLFWDYANDP